MFAIIIIVFCRIYVVGYGKVFQKLRFESFYESELDYFMFV